MSARFLPNDIHPGLLVAAAVFCFLSVISRAHFMTSSEGIDFFHFWAVPTAVEMGMGEDVYSTEGRTRLGQEFIALSGDASRNLLARAANRRPVWDTTATPALYAVMSPLRHMDYERSLTLYRYLLLFAGVAGIAFISYFAFRQPVVLTLVGTGLVCRFSSAFSSDLDVGNINSIQLLLLGVLLFISSLQKKTVRLVLFQGALLGLAIAIKPNLCAVALMLGLVYATAADFRRLGIWMAGVSIGGGVMILVGAWFFGGLFAWGEWVSILRSVATEGYPSDLGNYSIVRVILEKTETDISLPVLFAFLILFAILFRKTRETLDAFPREALAVCIGAALPLVTTALAWAHYYLLAVPLIFLLLSAKTSSPLRSSILAVAVALHFGWPQLARQLRETGGNALWVASNAISVILLLAIAGWDVLAGRFPPQFQGWNGTNDTTSAEESRRYA